jgi:hypothetical protein
VLDDVCERVEFKTRKILDEHAKRTDQERVPALNVNAESQGRYAVTALKPVVLALAALGAVPESLGLDTLPDRYAAAVRKRAAGGEGPTLRELVRNP